MEHRLLSARRLTLSTLGVAGALALVAALAAPAGASASIHVSTRAGSHAGLASGSASTYLAGYTVSPSGGLASASTTFKVPALDCSSGNTYGQAFGVGDEPTDGAPVTLATVGLICSGGSATYAFFFQANGGTAFEESGVSAGDTVVASLSQTASQVEVEMHDITSGSYWFATNSPAPESTITIGSFPLFSGGQLGIAPFAKTTFSKTQVNGDYLSFVSPTKTNEKRSGATLISTGSIPHNGDSFKLTFKNS
jgi:hypothetical protein